ncbi:MAG: RagB/SusD family nutrient uptake outer membrane protein [Cytophagales bacterium]|nr:RagB/SusD family nutrient uptake outer membrane protein [Cytophagales bacterium]
MRKIASALLLSAMLLGYESCKEKELDLKPGEPTEESFFSNEVEFNRGVIGIYQKLLYYYQIHRGNQTPWQGTILLADDDVRAAGASRIDQWNINVGDAEGIYRTSYEMIFRANALLDQLQKKGDVLSANNRKYYEGEALFLRAYANFLLWNTFGTAPNVTTRLELSELNTPNSQGTQLLDQAIEDLKVAETLLPTREQWGVDNLGRVTVGSAKALLGKAYLFKQEYGQAAAKLAEVTGYSLVPNYGLNFLPTSENNAESIFEVQFGPTIASENNGWIDNDNFTVVGTLAAYRGQFSIDFSWATGESFVPTTPLVNSFEPGDPRRRWTFFSVGDTLKKDGGLYTETTSKRSPSGHHFSKYLKFAGPDYGGPDFYANPSVDFNNERVLRYADVLLMRAEALNESGGSTTEIIGLINQVRARARNSTQPASLEPADRPLIGDRNQIMQWIMNERRTELALEGHRLFDLFRWHRAGKINLTQWNWDTANANWEPRNILFPIPQREIDLTNGSLQQNSGY